MEGLLAGVLLVLHCGSVLCQTATDWKNLKTHLFTTKAYDKELRPALDQTKSTLVYMDFYPIFIIELDEVSETLKTKGYLELVWTDEFLTWDPDNFGGIDEIFIPQNNVWRPDVTLQNSHDKFEEVGHSSHRVWVTSNGTVAWYPFQLFESSCKIAITHFPFDQQTCAMEFESWSYPERQVEMAMARPHMSLDWFDRNPLWEIVSTKTYEYKDGGFAMVFEFTLDRKPLNSILTFVCPVILLSILNLFVFVLPSDCGEKSGYAITVFLAFTVFMTIVESVFPPTSDTVAYFSYYVLMQTMQSTLIIMVTLFTIRLASLDNCAKVPGWVKTVVRLSRCKVPRKKSNLTRVEPQLQTTEMNKIPELATKTNIENWKSVVNALDRIFFVLFLLSFLTSTLVCILSAKYHY